MSNLTGDADTPDVQARILEAASRLISPGGVAALTTRAVAAAAAVQAPTLYRLFGDKRGLLDAVAERGLADFVATKAGADRHPDPVEDLRRAWAEYIAFGMENPAVFAIMNEIGRPGPPSPAMLAGMAVLRERVARIARAGRLRVPEERAVRLIHAAGIGTIATLLATPEDDRDPELAALALDALISVLVGAVAKDTVAPAFAIGLRAHLETATVLSPGEHLLMRELLDRLADQPS
jgi:AcrR family transcriptional regulator